MEPKNAAMKWNRVRIRQAIRQPMLKELVGLRSAGTCLAGLDDLQIDELADLMAGTVMKNEKVSISLRRSK